MKTTTSGLRRLRRGALALASLALVPVVTGCGPLGYLGAGIMAYVGILTIDFLQWPFRSLVGTLALQAINTIQF